jgi:phage terminase small subunit
MTRLTAKQERFCQEYLIDFNASAAARRAGYSEKSARATAERNMQKVDIKARIRELQQPYKEELDISVERVLRELASIAFAKSKQFMSWDSNNVTLISSDLLSDDDAAAVSGVTYTSTETQFGGSVRVDLKFHDKVRALQLLCDRYLSTDFAIDVLRRQGYDVIPRSLPPSESPQPAPDPEALS